MPDLPNSAMTMLRASTYRFDGGEGATERAPTALVVELLVDLDLSTVEGFRRSFRTLLDGVSGDELANGRLIVLDLSRVDFISVDGASALVDAKDQAVGYGLELRLVTPTRGVEHALAATGARRMFQRHDTVGSALEYERSPSDVLTDPAY